MATEDEDEVHKTTLRVPMALFRRIHRLWQRGQGEGWVSLKRSRAMYMIDLMEKGAALEEAAHPAAPAPRKR